MGEGAVGLGVEFGFENAEDESYGSSRAGICVSPCPSHFLRRHDPTSHVPTPKSMPVTCSSPSLHLQASSGSTGLSQAQASRTLEARQARASTRSWSTSDAWRDMKWRDMKLARYPNRYRL